jgi:hypothetical protein
MNRARAFVNDAFQGGAGRILTNTAPFTVEYLNSALEELQDKIGNNGVITLIKDNYIATPILPYLGPDPNVQQQLAYTGFFDGVTWNKIPTLPLDMAVPFKLWTRQTGSGLPFTPMSQPQEGLVGLWPTCSYLTSWEFRTDSIFLIPANQNADIRIRYESRLLEIPPDSSTDDWVNTQISIFASTNALATIVAYLYARARGAQAAPQVQTDGERMMRYIVRRYTRRAQSIEYRREPYGDDVGDIPNLPY